MNFVLTFAEGLASFVSPCVLPLVPVYVIYFAAGDGDGRGRVAARAAAFVAGFTLAFVLLGVLAGSLGSLLAAHRSLVARVCGAFVVVLALGYLGLFKLPFGGAKAIGRKVDALGAFLFGIVFSVFMTPCVGVFLGAALATAAAEGGAANGAALLLAYSLGLGVPFFVSALAVDRLKGLFAAVKSRYRAINAVCGALLLAVGAWMLLPSFAGCVSSPVRDGAATEEARPQVRSVAGSGEEAEIDVTDATFDEIVLRSELPVLCDFWASWCGPCRKLAPIVSGIASDYRGKLIVCKIDVDANPALSRRFRIQGMPTLIVFKGGQMIEKSVGYSDRAEIDKKLLAKVLDGERHGRDR